MEDEESVALAWLKGRIEDLSFLPPLWSKTTFAPSGYPHDVCQRTIMGHSGVHVRDCAEAILADVREAKSMRVGGPAILIWRVEPEIRTSAEGEGSIRSIYCRLSFVPDTFGREPKEA